MLSVIKRQILQERFSLAVNNVYERTRQINGFSALKVNSQVQDYLSNLNKRNFTQNVEEFLERDFHLDKEALFRSLCKDLFILESLNMLRLSKNSAEYLSLLSQLFQEKKELMNFDQVFLYL